MYFHFSRRQWVIILRRGDIDPGNKKSAIGIMIKPVSEKLFSERYRGYKHAFTIGKLYFRTFKRQPIVHRPEDYVSPTAIEIQHRIAHADTKMAEISANMKKLHDQLVIRWYAGMMIDDTGNVTYLRPNPETGKLEPGPCPWPTAPSADDPSS